MEIYKKCVILYIWRYKYENRNVPYKNINLKTNKILEQLTLSSRALAEWKGYSNTIPNMLQPMMAFIKC